MPRKGFLDPSKYTGDTHDLADAILELQKDTGSTLRGLRFENEEALQLAIDNQVAGDQLPRPGSGTDEDGVDGAVTLEEVQDVIDARAASSEAAPPQLTPAEVKAALAARTTKKGKAKKEEAA